MRKITDKNNFTFIDLTPTFKNYSQEEILFPMPDGHPNKEGHRLIADDIVNVLIEKVGMSN